MKKFSEHVQSSESGHRSLY